MIGVSCVDNYPSPPTDRNKKILEILFSAGGVLLFVLSALVIIALANYTFPLIFMTKKPLFPSVTGKVKTHHFL